MKISLFASILLVIVSTAFSMPDRVLRWSVINPAQGINDEGQHDFELNLEKEWASFKLEYGRDFNSGKDDLVRKSIFETNLKTIKMHNFLYLRGLTSFTMAVNKFSDLTSEEFRSLMNAYKRPFNYTRTGSTYLEPLNVASSLPESVDWRAQGYVTGVKNQGGCGSCWAFSATGAIEGQHFRKTGNLVSLSEQNLVDCSSKYGNQGCNGGLMDSAFKYVKENGGIDTEESYPYVGVDQECRFRKDGIGATVTGFMDVPSGDEKKLMQTVASVGPVSVAIDAAHSSFQHYHKGVYDEPKCSSSNLDHGVLVVGYGREGGKDYWLVKNSWGTQWGDQGYIKMVRNEENQCGIASSASYPLV